jgi:segregation and condensation protein A
VSELAVPAVRLRHAHDLQEELFSGHRVVISIFEGPLDLLLYLVRRREVDVLEVPAAEITRQFVEYLKTMEVLNIELASEFVVTAASLVHLKSCMLLPVQELAEEERLEDLAPQVELARQLLEYRGFKDAAELLAESRERRQHIFMRACGEEGVGTGFVNLGDISVFDIVSAFRELLERAEPDTPTLELRPPQYTVAGQIAHVLSVLRMATRPLTFVELFVGRVTRLQVVMTFVAILELLRRQRIVVRQRRPYDEIYIEPKHGFARTDG